MHIYQLSTDFLGILKGWCNGGGLQGGVTSAPGALLKVRFLSGGTSLGAVLHCGHSPARCSRAVSLGHGTSERPLITYCKIQSFAVGERDARGTYGTLILGAGTGERIAQYSVGRETGWI